MGLLDNIYGWSDPNSYYPDATINTNNVGGLLMGGSSAPASTVKSAGSSWLDDPSNMGLLGAAAALLKAGAPSTVPVSFGSAIGQGLMGGMQGYESAKKLQQQLLGKEAMKPQLVEVDGVKKWVMPGQSEGVVVGKVASKDPEWMSRDTNGNPIINPLYVQMKQFEADVNHPPSYDFRDITGGLGRLNKKTGDVSLVDGGRLFQSPQYDPELQGQIAQSRETGKVNVQRGLTADKADKTANNLDAGIAEANQLLMSDPTHSTLGTMIDSANRFFGRTTDSAQVAARLKTLSGWLTSNVPRMEGPQGENDRKMYAQMAADVGDNTIPVLERLASLKTLDDLQKKYRANNALFRGQDSSAQSGYQQPQSSAGPMIGTISKGYRFRGGNPADRNSWEKL